MMAGLTQLQVDCLNFVKSFLRESGGVSPSYREIARALDIKSKSGAMRLIEALVQRGAIRRLDNTARSIILVEDAKICAHCGEIAGSAKCVANAQATRTPQQARQVALASAGAG